MKVENMTYNAKTAFTERREIIDKLNECINSINTYGPEKIADLESKNVQQDSDIANLKTKNENQDIDINNLKSGDTNNVKINKINEYAVGLTGNQDISGQKSFVNGIITKTNIPGGSSPENYSANLYDWCVKGNDGMPIISCGHEKSTTNTTRLVFTIFGNTDIETNKQPSVQVHFIFNEEGSFTMRPSHTDKNGNRNFGAEQVLMKW